VLVTRHAGRLACVTQYEHGGVAGALAAHWGNERFEGGEPHAPLVRAATHHDDGWHALDDIPFVNREAGRPAHFTEVPSPMTIAAYGGGVEALYERDSHAGMLVSMHWSGLFAARWGLQEGGPSDSPAARATVAEQERRWRTTALELWGFRGLRSEFEARLWHSYDVLQALDLLSLFLCLVDLDHATDLRAPLVAVQATLRDLDQRPGARALPAVPTRRGGAHVTLTAAVLAPGVVGITPFPFGGEAVSIEIPVRRLARTTYASAARAADAYHAAAVSPVRCTLVADPSPVPRP
jgi:hypothetical protein